MASTVFAAIAATMSLTFIRISWKSALRTPNFGPIGVDEHVADRRADLVGDLLAFEVGDRFEVQVLAGHDLRGLADIFDQRDRDQAAAVVADQERLSGIGAEVDLAAHHLLHGEIAGRRPRIPGTSRRASRARPIHQVIGRHAPDVGLVALTDGRHLGGRRLARRARAPARSLRWRRDIAGASMRA